MNEIINSGEFVAIDDEDINAAIYSKEDLVINGNGSLTVTANNRKEKSAIASDDYVRIMDSPKITVISGSSAGHGVRGNDYVRISNGTLTVSTSAAMKKGISFSRRP